MTATRPRVSLRSAPETPPSPFAGRIRRRLRERGLGLREFCRAADLDPSFFSKVLSGKRNPPSEESVLRRIAEALELDAPNLIVSAGRVPAEWRRLWEDPSLFSAVHRLACAKTGAWKATGKPAAAPGPPRPAAKDLGAELL